MATSSIMANFMCSKTKVSNFFVGLLLPEIGDMVKCENPKRAKK